VGVSPGRLPKNSLSEVAEGGKSLRHRFASRSAKGLPRKSPFYKQKKETLAEDELTAEIESEREKKTINRRHEVTNAMGESSTL